MAGPRKPLYLDGRRQAIEVRLRGPALTVLRGPQRLGLPLARLSRVLVCGDVRWDARAITACLQQPIPIVFLDGSARPLGAAMPLVARTAPVGEALSDWVDRPHWRSEYDNWLRAQRLGILQCWRRGLAQVGRPLHVSEWREALRSFVYMAQATFVGPHAGSCYAIVLQLLLREGIRTQYRGADGSVLALARDLACLADCRIALTMGSLAAAFDGQGELKARAAGIAAAEVAPFVADLLQRLSRCAAEWSEPWP